VRAESTRCTVSEVIKQEAPFVGPQMWPNFAQREVDETSRVEFFHSGCIHNCMCIYLHARAPDA